MGAAIPVAGAWLTKLVLDRLTSPSRPDLVVWLYMGVAVLAAVGAVSPQGAMLETFWWGSVFLLGVPAMVLLLVLGPVLLPEYRNPGAARLDLISVVLSLSAGMPMVYGLKQLARDGWHATSVAAVLIGLVFVVLFVRRQRRLREPLVDLRLFANREFSVALGAMLTGTMLMGAAMVFVTQDLQLVAHFSRRSGRGCGCCPVSARRSWDSSFRHCWRGGFGRHCSSPLVYASQWPASA